MAEGRTTARRQEIIAIERIEGETNALWGMWKASSAASGSRLSVPPEVWLSYFSTFYHSPRSICLPRSLTGPPDAFLDRAFSTTDVLRAVSHGANGKASGPDRLTNECLKDALGCCLFPLQTYSTSASLMAAALLSGVTPIF